MHRSGIVPFISAVLAIWALSSCSGLGYQECEDRNCAAETYRVGFRDSAWNWIDTLKSDPVHLLVVGGTVEYLGKIAASADCASCASSFLGSRLASDRALRSAAGDTIPAGSNLLDPQIVDNVGRSFQSSLSFFRETRFSPGRNTFTFEGSLDGRKYTLFGSVWVPDTLAF